MVQVGAERYNLFMGCPHARTATLVLRGGSEQFIDEADRSLHDAIMIVRRALKHAQVRWNSRWALSGECVNILIGSAMSSYVPLLVRTRVLQAGFKPFLVAFIPLGSRLSILLSSCRWCLEAVLSKWSSPSFSVIIACSSLVR